MLEYQIAEIVLAIARNALLLDTNVLVDAFQDASDEYADLFFAEFPGPLLVPAVVIVEAWGLLVGRGKSRLAGLALLRWLNLPNRAIIVPSHLADVGRIHRIVGGHIVDCVDAMLVELASDISQRCNLRPPLAIATSDTRDFTRLLLQRDLRFGIFDMRSKERLDIDR